LPAMGWGEKDGTVTNSERRISRQRRIMPAAGEAREDWRIMCDVAKRMGFDGFGFQNSAEIFAEHAALTGVLNNGARSLDLTQVAAQNFDDLQPQQWGGAQPFADGQFETPDRKARFISTRFAIAKTRDGFTLNTGRIRDQWHTMTRTGLVPKLFGHRAEPYLEISTSDAGKLGLRDAGLASINGGNGSSVVRVLVSDSVADGEVFQPMHWSAVFASAPKANAASVGVVDPVSGQPALKSARVAVRRFDAAWYGYGVTVENPTLAFDYWALRPLDGGQSFECAGLECPADWRVALGKLVDFNDESLRIAFVQASSGAFRCVVTREGVLQFAFFASDTPVQASRHWLQQLLGQKVMATAVLAGRPVAGQMDAGPIVCACNGVGATQIKSAIAAMPGASLHMICEKTRAGTGCGSCRPEVLKLMGATSQRLLAAE
jgi:assimilatory nitrate reductase catalytic subunit